jgi:predicted dehydrogenase
MGPMATRHDRSALLRFQGGAYGTVVSSRHFPHPANDVVIYGTKSRIRGSGTVGMRLVGLLEIVGNSSPSTSEFPCNDPVTGTYLLQVESFNRNIRENTEPNASGCDGLEMARIVKAILDSHRQGKAVRIER